MSLFIKKLKLWIRLKTMSFGYLMMKAPQPGKWVFILGCYNSGTTLLHRLLSTHPEIGSMPNEGQFYSKQLPGGAKFDLPRLWALKPELFYIDENSTPPVDANRLKREWAWFYNYPRKKILIEKTILNSARSRWLQKHFHESYFIIIFRNGYAVSEGIHRKEGHAIEIAARQWAVSNGILLKDLNHLRHKHILYYEDLVTDPAQVMKGVTDFLSVPPLDNSVFQTGFTIHKRISNIKDMNEESIERLSRSDIEKINREAGNILTELKYPLIKPDAVC